MTTMLRSQTMKLTVFLASIAGASALRKPIAFSQESSEFLLRESFNSFVEKYEKVYETEEERLSRFFVFAKNVENIAAKNNALAKLGKDQVHGINKFADMTKDEFASKLLNPMMSDSIAASNVSWATATPTKKATASTFNWVDEGATTPVKNQKYCGSCWAFSATETVESQYILAGGDMTELSVQQTVSCDTTDAGCSGGWYYTAWTDYMEPNGGLALDSTYPYNTATSFGHATTCDTSLESETVSGTTPSGYSWATPTCSSRTCDDQDEDTLKDNLVSYGPISIAADASEWSSYTSGVFSTSDCSNSAYKLDHAIQLVGYNEDASTPYWIVRNSWDTTWGVDGFIYLEMGVNACGLADKAAMVQL